MLQLEIVGIDQNLGMAPDTPIRRQIPENRKKNGSQLHLWQCHYTMPQATSEVVNKLDAHSAKAVRSQSIRR